MTSMESKLYQLSVNRHTLEDFRFSCWGIFSQSEYTTPWGKESFLSCWTGLAKIDMCNWLWSQLGSSFHILPEPHHKLAGKTSLSDLIICAELQSNRLTSLALSVLLFPKFVRCFLQTCKPLTMSRGKPKRDVSLQCTGVWVGSNLRGRRWPGPDVLRWKCKCQKPPALLCSCLFVKVSELFCIYRAVFLFLMKRKQSKKIIV